MTQGKEMLAAAAWLYSKLAADSALTAVVSTRIYNEVAPQNATYPLVVYQMQSAVDLPAAGGGRILTNSQWLVRAISTAPTFGGDLATAATRIDVVLQAAEGSVTDGYVVACVRSRVFQMVESDSGVQYRHLGGFYEIAVQ